MGDSKRERIAWLGPQIVSENGLELRGIVTEDRKGQFHAGTLYGPKGGAMPELGPEAFMQTTDFKDRDKAIKAAEKDVQWALNGCNAQARAERIMEKATTPGKTEGKGRSARSRGIER